MTGWLCSQEDPRGLARTRGTDPQGDSERERGTMTKKIYPVNRSPAPWALCFLPFARFEHRSLAESSQRRGRRYVITDGESILGLGGLALPQSFWERWLAHPKL